MTTPRQDKTRQDKAGQDSGRSLVTVALVVALALVGTALLGGGNWLRAVAAETVGVPPTAPADKFTSLDDFLAAFADYRYFDDPSFYATGNSTTDNYFDRRMNLVANANEAVYEVRTRTFTLPLGAAVLMDYVYKADGTNYPFPGLFDGANALTKNSLPVFTNVPKPPQKPYIFTGAIWFEPWGVSANGANPDAFIAGDGNYGFLQGVGEPSYTYKDDKSSVLGGCSNYNAALDVSVKMSDGNYHTNFKGAIMTFVVDGLTEDHAKQYKNTFIPESIVNDAKIRQALKEYGFSGYTPGAEGQRGHWTDKWYLYSDGANFVPSYIQDDPNFAGNYYYKKHYEFARYCDESVVPRKILEVYEYNALDASEQSRYQKAGNWLDEYITKARYDSLLDQTGWEKVEQSYLNENNATINNYNGIIDDGDDATFARIQFLANRQDALVNCRDAGWNFICDYSPASASTKHLYKLRLVPLDPVNNTSSGQGYCYKVAYPPTPADDKKMCDFPACSVEFPDGRDNGCPSYKNDFKLDRYLEAAGTSAVNGLANDRKDDINEIVLAVVGGNPATSLATIEKNLNAANGLYDFAKDKTSNPALLFDFDKARFVANYGVVDAQHNLDAANAFTYNQFKDRTDIKFRHFKTFQESGLNFSDVSPSSSVNAEKSGKVLESSLPFNLGEYSGAITAGGNPKIPLNAQTPKWLITAAVGWKLFFSAAAEKRRTTYGTEAIYMKTYAEGEGVYALDHRHLQGGASEGACPSPANLDLLRFGSGANDYGGETGTYVIGRYLVPPPPPSCAPLSACADAAWVKANNGELCLGNSLRTQVAVTSTVKRSLVEQIVEIIDQNKQRKVGDIINEIYKDTALGYQPNAASLRSWYSGNPSVGNYKTIANGYLPGSGIEINPQAIKNAAIERVVLWLFGANAYDAYHADDIANRRKFLVGAGGATDDFYDDYVFAAGADDYYRVLVATALINIGKQTVVSKKFLQFVYKKKQNGSGAVVDNHWLDPE
ncbi:hypothetical protein FACS1894139_04250 [Planctomycetales bacterium]|nr:hypothetical protein FACS1894107_13630 [Planctomycetales bacterium]GHS97310.1 hypothetical protein FACS1894108_03460 [Planctomycetales bacterium]GHT03596.1 hypothetical protein FACS1894139_04250 [Planctomycetales bacterium]